MGIFEDIVDQIIALVDGLIGTAIDDVKTWATNTINAIVAPIQEAVSYVSDYVLEVYNNLTESIANTYTIIMGYVTSEVSILNTYVLTAYNALTDYVTNAIANSTAWVNNQITGISSYVDERILVWDPAGFLKDPLTYIGAAFTNFIEAWVHGVAKALGEGLQAGLKGSNPGPQGPGRSFMLGFEEALETPQEE